MCPQPAPVTVEDVRKVIDTMIRDGDVALNRVAGRLGISVRSLQRTLADRGVTYTEILEVALFERACRHLERTDRKIGEISRLLGYRDASNFSRAFQRWSGQPPRAWRKIRAGN